MKTWLIDVTKGGTVIDDYYAVVRPAPFRYYIVPRELLGLDDALECGLGVFSTLRGAVRELTQAWDADTRFSHGPVSASVAREVVS